MTNPIEEYFPHLPAGKDPSYFKNHSLMKQKLPYRTPACEKLELRLEGILAASGEFDLPGDVPQYDF